MLIQQEKSKEKEKRNVMKYKEESADEANIEHSSRTQ